MTGTESASGSMALSMRRRMLLSGRPIRPFRGPDVIWNELNERKGLNLGNLSVSTL